MSIALHWCSAIAVVYLWVAGKSIRMSAATEAAAAVAAHVSWAITLCLALWWRVIWRYRNGHPDAPAGARPWSSRLAKYIHWGLLAMLNGLLLSGPLLALSRGQPLPLPGGLAITNPWAFSPRLYSAMHLLHGLFANGLAIGVAVHVCAVLKHVIVDSDGTLDRMIAPPGDKAR